VGPGVYRPAEGGKSGLISTPQLHACDVHRILDFDTTERLSTYCPLCSAWVCTECAPNWPRRLKAALKRRLEPGANVQEGYIETLEREVGNERHTNS